MAGKLRRVFIAADVKVQVRAANVTWRELRGTM
jgi:hypothetical protein